MENRISTKEKNRLFNHWAAKCRRNARQLPKSINKSRAQTESEQQNRKRFHWLPTKFGKNHWQFLEKIWMVSNFSNHEILFNLWGNMRTWSSQTHTNHLITYLITKSVLKKSSKHMIYKQTKSLGSILVLRQMILKVFLLFYSWPLQLCLMMIFKVWNLKSQKEYLTSIQNFHQPNSVHLAIHSSFLNPLLQMSNHHMIGAITIQARRLSLKILWLAWIERTQVDLYLNIKQRKRLSDSD